MEIEPEMQLEMAAMSMYYHHIKKYPNALSWKNLPAAETRFWLQEAKVSLHYEKSGLNHE